ncbi:hypothetical protein [Methylobacterium organophilum]|uniref:hypothetical protein n=1 Tax=Methylobacterium organophilum TaxID=410 RepID=UPI001EE1D203|nr:hypothetical protein [Methylobacterium organophilum]
MIGIAHADHLLGLSGDGLARAIFGGFAPAVYTDLIHETGNRAMPGLRLACPALFSITGTLTLFRNTSLFRRPSPPTSAAI